MGFISFSIHCLKRAAPNGAALIHLDRLGTLVPENEPEIKGYIADIQNVATKLLENLRKIIWDLRPSILDDLGLASAIRWFARTNLEKAGVKVDFYPASGVIRLPPHLETILFRIAQEAISNILRHAKASKVSIRLWTVDEQIWLEIKDDGGGFDVEKTREGVLNHTKLGLSGIQERASLVHGEVKIESAPEFGTCLQVHIPLPAESSTGSEPNRPNLPEHVI